MRPVATVNRDRSRTGISLTSGHPQARISERACGLRTTCLSFTLIKDPIPYKALSTPSERHAPHASAGFEEGVT